MNLWFASFCSHSDNNFNLTILVTWCKGANIRFFDDKQHTYACSINLKGDLNRAKRCDPQQVSQEHCNFRCLLKYNNICCLSHFHFNNENISDQTNEEWIQIGVHYIDYTNARKKKSKAKHHLKVTETCCRLFIQSKYNNWFVYTVHYHLTSCILLSVFVGHFILFHFH